MKKVFIFLMVVSFSVNAQYLGQTYLETIDKLNKDNHSPLFKVTGKNDNLQIQTFEYNNNSKHITEIYKFRNDTCFQYIQFRSNDRLQGILYTFQGYKELGDLQWLDIKDKNIFWSIKKGKYEFQLVQEYKKR